MKHVPADDFEVEIAPRPTVGALFWRGLVFGAAGALWLYVVAIALTHWTSL